MTRGQIIADLKKLIGPGIEVDDAGLGVWVNDAYMQMVDAIKQVNPDFFTKSSTTSTVASQQEYALPDDHEQVLMVNIQFDGTWTRALPIPQINNILTHASGTPEGWSQANPGYYVIGSEIGFMPIPEDTVSGAIKLWYTYTPEELDEDSDVPALPAKFHHIIKYGAYANYLDQDDEHAAAERMRQRFDQRTDDMVESMFTNQIDEPKSVTVTSNQDLYYDEDGWI